MNKKVLKRALALSMSLFMAVSSFNVYAEDTVSDDISEETTDDIGYDDSMDTDYAVGDEEVDEQTTELSTDTAVEDSGTQDSLEDNLEYFLIDSPLLNAPDTQNFVASFIDASNYSDFSITVKDSSGNEEEIKSDTVSGNLVKFSKEYSKNSSGEYSVTKLSYVKNNDGCLYYLDLSSMDVKFGVDQEYDGYDELVNLESLNEDSSLEGVIQVTSLEDAESEVASGIVGTSAMSISDLEDGISAQSNEDIVICLDPGHGGVDSGAVGNGVQEKDLNLKIANYCKQELEKYNCTVVMTRTTDVRLGSDASEDLEARADYAKKMGASYLISIHINSDTTSTNSGAEVYYPNDHWRADLGNNGKVVAQAVENQLVALGLKNRGIKTRTIDPVKYPDYYRYADESVADYYGIIRNAKYNGLTGLIIEHCYINNSSDYQNFLSSDAKLKQLGVADAKGIVSALNLSTKDTKTSIAGACRTSVSEMVKYFNANGGTYDKFSKYGTQYDGVLAKGGASTIEEFCQIFYEEAKAEGIRPEVAFCQSMKETGFLKFGGQVKPDQYNYAGIGATDDGASGATFTNVRMGVRAQIQHLKAYANKEALNNECVDPRFEKVTRGSAQYVEWLGQKENPNGLGWATAQNYGYQIVSMINNLLSYNNGDILSMYRLYNPNSGEHFYTSSNGEKNNLINLGWSYEGVGWYAPKSSDNPVYRLYNANGGEHHYTMSSSEKDMLVSKGWSYEGIGWYSADPNSSNSISLLREYNPNAFANNHNYTTSNAEHSWLISLGWRDEGKAWYGLKVE